MHVLSQEAIAFQAASAPKNLANELTAIFQNVIDFRNKQVYSDADRVKKTFDYFTKTAAPKMLSVIEKYTGMQMEACLPKRLIANWAILMLFDEGKDDSLEDIIRSYSGIMNDDSYSKYVKEHSKLCKRYDELESFASSISKDTGFVDAGLMKKHKFKCKLYFDVYGSFLIKETGARACAPLTAEEITAVLLHEIGHALSLIEHAADMYFKKDVLENTTKIFLKEAPMEEKIKFAVANTKHLYPEMVGKSKEAEDYIKTNRQKQGNLITTGFEMLINTICMLIVLLKVEVARLWSRSIGQLIDITISNPHEAMTEMNHGKLSDYYDGPINYMYCEVLADQYVTRFGYGGHLASMLKKINEWFRITGLGDMNMAQFDSACFYGRMLPWVMATAILGDHYSSDYPNEKQRYELLMLNTLKAFKEHAMDDAMLEDYYRSYKTIKQILDNPTAAQKYVTACNYLQNAIQYIVKTPRSLLFTGRFYDEYARLYDQVQKLSNNELYALAYQLRNPNRGN